MDQIAVIGAGTMGSGIAQVIAQAGFEVVLRDLKEEYLQQGLKKIKQSLEQEIEKGNFDDKSRTKVLDRIKLTTQLDELAEVVARVIAVDDFSPEEFAALLPVSADSKKKPTQKEAAE